jgi:hypothetical protein
MRMSRGLLAGALLAMAAAPMMALRRVGAEQEPRQAPPEPEPEPEPAKPAQTNAAPRPLLRGEIPYLRASGPHASNAEREKPEGKAAARRRRQMARADAR